MLLSANLNDQITVYTDQLDQVIGLGYNVSATVCSSSELDSWKASEKTFRTKASVRTPSDGARVKKHPAKRGEQAVEEETSFFVRYWYYIVPAVLLLVVNLAAGSVGA